MAFTSFGLRFITCGLAGLIAFAAGASPVLRAAAARQTDAAEARTLWMHDEGKSIDLLEPTSAGHLLMLSDNRIAVLDRESGTAVWSRDDIRGCFRVRETNLVKFRHLVRCKHLGKDLGFGLVPSDTDPPLLVGHNPEDGIFAAIDAATGRTVYDSRETPGKVRNFYYAEGSRQIALWIERENERYVFAVVGSNGQLGPAFDTTIKNELVWLGARDASSVTIYGKDRDDKRVVAEIDLKANRMAWQVAGALNEDIEDGPKVIGGGGKWRQKPYKFSLPVFDTDSSVVLFITPDGPMRVSRDGKVLWRADALRGKKPAFTQADEGLVVVADERDVVGIDAATGKVLWRHKGRGNLAGIESHTRGVLIWSDESAALLNPKTGAAVWSREAQLPEKWDNGFWLVEDMRPDYSRTRAPKRIVGDTAYVAGATRLVALNLRDGSVKDIVGYKFEGNVPITMMEIVDDDFVLTAPDAVARYDRDGKTQFHQYFKAVGNSAGAKAGAIANYFLNPFSSLDPSPMDAFLAQRYTVSGKDDRYSFFHYENTDGNLEKKFGIICVERATGKAIGAYWVNDRDPVVVTDPVTKTIYLQEKKNAIRAIRF